MSARGVLGKQWPVVEHGDSISRELVAYHLGAPRSESLLLEEHHVGVVKYADVGTHVEVYHRHTHEDFRGQGIASHLQDALEQRAAGRPIVSDGDSLSTDAHRLRESYRKRNPGSRWVVGAHNPL